MPTQSAFADAFAGALLNQAAPLPVSVISHTAAPPQKRFGVYRNNVTHGLVEALRTRFPAVERIVGKEFFIATALAFVRAHPPRSRLMMHFGDDFPAFLATFAPAGELPYLADVARIEAARTRAYHAADAVPMEAAALQRLSPDALFALRLALHPSAEIIRSPYPVVTIWAMNTGPAVLGPVDLEQSEQALVVRPAYDVQVFRLPPGGATFLATLGSSATLGEAAEAAAGTAADFDLTANLALLLHAGAAIFPTP